MSPMFMLFSTLMSALLLTSLSIVRKDHVPYMSLTVARCSHRTTLSLCIHVLLIRPNLFVLSSNNKADFYHLTTSGALSLGPRTKSLRSVMYSLLLAGPAVVDESCLLRSIQAALLHLHRACRHVAATCARRSGRQACNQER